MYCTILCTKEENCIGTKAEGGSCYLYKDGLAGYELDKSSKLSSGIWLRSKHMWSLSFLRYLKDSENFAGVSGKNFYS